MASANEIRDTPGRLLLGWAVLLTSLVLLSWRIHLRPVDYEWTEYPTALGDLKYYRTLGQDDRYEPNLRYARQDEGLFRRAEEAMEFEDGTMMKRGLDVTGSHFIYQPEGAGEKGPLPVYLKSGENRYVEFGERKLYPPFVPKAGP